ncbi:MAG: hypothetical protein U0X91_27475 [Spirosomataceae bacterium]
MNATAPVNPKELIAQLPKRYGYANKITHILQQKGITVTQTAIYHTVAGKSHNLEVINALMDVVEEYQSAHAHVNNRYNSMKAG